MKDLKNAKKATVLTDSQLVKIIGGTSDYIINEDSSVM